MADFNSNICSELFQNDVFFILIFFSNFIEYHWIPNPLEREIIHQSWPFRYNTYIESSWLSKPLKAECTNRAWERKKKSFTHFQPTTPTSKSLFRMAAGWPRQLCGLDFRTKLRSHHHTARASKVGIRF